nr:hypothetical protein [Candidatus Sigynarchaeota archaeon]
MGVELFAWDPSGKVIKISIDSNIACRAIDSLFVNWDYKDIYEDMGMRGFDAGSVGAERLLSAIAKIEDLAERYKDELRSARDQSEFHDDAETAIDYLQECVD